MLRYFDDDLSRVHSIELKTIVKRWGGDYKMRKDECIAFLCAALKDPAKIQAFITNLQPWERNALAFIKQAGGSILSEPLKISIFSSGIYPEPTGSYKDNFEESLVRQGLVLAADQYGPDYFGSRSSVSVYSDERLLAQVGLPENMPFDIQPMSLPGETHARRPSAVTMDIVRILQTVNTLGGLKLTQQGVVRVNDATKLRKALGWDEDSVEVDGFVFPYPQQAWLDTLRAANLITKMENELLWANTPEEFAQHSFVEQIRLVMKGLAHARDWAETSSPASYVGGNQFTRAQARSILIQAIAALPLNSNGFFSLGQFEQALFNRVGYVFSLGYIPAETNFYRETPAEKKQKLAEWQAKIRATWLKQEAIWLGKALSTWLYFLGLVELLTDGDHLIGFRLTDLGRETFHPELPSTKLPEPSIQATPIGPAWVVLPNFDIITYMDRVSTTQMAFLERCAERSQAQKHTANYRLTRDSIYRGLESGLTLDELVNTLQIGSQTELSQNILVEIREWASLRERIFLHHKANLLEFLSPQALKTRLEQGLKGTIVADRFLLLDAAPPASGWPEINYAETLPPNLSLTETGRIDWKPTKHHDLVTAAQLDQWAEPTADGGWQLTHESIGRALKPGRKLSDLLNLLQHRVFSTGTIRKYELPPPSIPPLLELALRSWAGTNYPITLQNIILIQCSSEKIYQAVISSPLMNSLIKGHQAPDLLFADPAQIETLRQRLNWLGWKVTDKL